MQKIALLVKTGAFREWPYSEVTADEKWKQKHIWVKSVPNIGL